MVVIVFTRLIVGYVNVNLQWSAEKLSENMDTSESANSANFAVKYTALKHAFH